MQAIGTNKPEECVMVGDDFERDIKGALNAGLQAVYYRPIKEEEKQGEGYYIVSRLEELINIL